jgi:hypothetical protein
MLISIRTRKEYCYKQTSLCGCQQLQYLSLENFEQTEEA